MANMYNAATLANPAVPVGRSTDTTGRSTRTVTFSNQANLPTHAVPVGQPAAVSGSNMQWPYQTTAATNNQTSMTYHLGPIRPRNRRRNRQSEYNRLAFRLDLPDFDPQQPPVGNSQVLIYRPQPNQLYGFNQPAPLRRTIRLTQFQQSAIRCRQLEIPNGFVYEDPPEEYEAPSEGYEVPSPSLNTIAPLDASWHVDPSNSIPYRQFGDGGPRFPQLVTSSNGQGTYGQSTLMASRQYGHVGSLFPPQSGDITSNAASALVHNAAIVTTQSNDGIPVQPTGIMENTPAPDSAFMQEFRQPVVRSFYPEETNRNAHHLPPTRVQESPGYLQAQNEALNAMTNLTI